MADTTLFSPSLLNLTVQSLLPVSKYVVDPQLSTKQRSLIVSAWTGEPMLYGVWMEPFEQQVIALIASDSLNE